MVTAVGEKIIEPRFHFLSRSNRTRLGRSQCSCNNNTSRVSVFLVKCTVYTTVYSNGTNGERYALPVSSFFFWHDFWDVFLSPFFFGTIVWYVFCLLFFWYYFWYVLFFFGTIFGTFLSPFFWYYFWYFFECPFFGTIFWYVF